MIWAYLKNSILAKILITVAAILIFTDIGLLVLGYSSVHTTVRKNYVAYATASATVAADLLDGAELERFQTDEEYTEYYRMVLEDLCRTNDLEYLYIYTPDTENNTITFHLLIYGENSKASAMKERTPGTVVPYSLTEAEVCAWNGRETKKVEETDNEYGHVMTAYSAIYDSDGNVSALAGADVSLDEAFRIFFQRYRMMFAAVTVSFVFVLSVLAIILKVRVLKPAELISRQMKEFADNRQPGFGKIEIKGRDEFAQMADAFNYMTEEIDNYIKNINHLTEEKHRREAEISIAGKIQRGLLPDKSFQNHGIKLAAVMLPANYVGGDFYDYFSLTDETVCTVIADVSGKGISAAVFMASAITVVKQYAKFGYSPSEILFHANNILSQSNPEQMFLTLFVGIYNSSTHKYTYANGGHNLPYLLSDTLKCLEGAKGLAIGVFEDEIYEEEEIVLNEGDTIFLYTDGVNEAVSRDGEFFGILRLEHALKEKAQEKCVDVVLEAVRKFAQDAPQSDDITMLAFCVLPDFHINVEANLGNFDIIQEFIVGDGRIPPSIKKRLCLAAEEIFVNICSYAYEGKGLAAPEGRSMTASVEVTMQISEQIVMKFCDSGKRFNPLENMEDISNYDMDAQIGGLGRQIAFNLADEAQYEYSNGKNILTLIFYGGNKNDDYENNGK